MQAKEENKPDIAQYRIDVGQNDKAHVMAPVSYTHLDVYKRQQ